MSNTYFQIPFDPTGYTTITGAQLAQLVGGLGPLSQFGLCTVTTDDAFGVPAVPNPATNPSLTSFLWLRVGNATNASATLYVWNPNASAGVLLKWQIANINSITAGSITGSQIAPLTITDGNIFSVNWTKLPSGGAVGGCLVGSMPNPSLANGIVGAANITALSITGGNTITSIIGQSTVTSWNIAANTITNANIAANTITNTSIATADATGIMDNQIMSIAQAGGGLNPVGASGKLKASGTAYQILAMNSAATQLGWISDWLYTLQAGAAGVAGQYPVLAAGAVSFQWANQTFKKISTAGISSGLGTLGASVPGVLYTFAHGLGNVPTQVIIQILCATTDAATGYTAATTLDPGLLSWGLTGSNVLTSGIKWYADATNVYVISYGASGSDTFAYLVPTAGTAAVKPTTANNFVISVIALE